MASHPDHDSLEMDASNVNADHHVTGCVFWLSVPLVLPKSSSAPALSISPLPAQLDAKMASLEVDKTMTDADDSKLMPAPNAIPLKRSLAAAETANTASDSSSRVAKKPALKRSTPGQKKADVYQPSSAEVEMQEDDFPTERSKRALIIDDSLTIRKGLARGFSRLGFDVDEAENGLQGFNKLKADLYDICLLDFLMPVMDGPDVARKFRAWENEHRPDFHQVSALFSWIAKRAHLCRISHRLYRLPISLLNSTSSGYLRMQMERMLSWASKPAWIDSWENLFH